MKILIASNNEHKRKEIEAYLSPLGIHCLTPKDLGIDLDPAETADTFSGNAFLKAEEFFLATDGKYPVLSDDSGLCVEALDGRPGVLSARYGGKEISFARRNALLLEELAGSDNLNAYFVTHLCLYLGSHRIITIEESLEGSIGKPKESTEEGFGYDPIFYPGGMSRSLAECTLDEKNQISSRGKALAELAWILSKPNFLQKDGE